MDASILNNTFDRVVDTEKHLDQLQKRQTYLDGLLDKLLGTNKDSNDKIIKEKIKN